MNPNLKYLKDVHEDTHSAGMCIFLVMQLLCFQSHLALSNLSGDALIDKCYGLRCTALRLVLYELFYVPFYVGTFFEKLLKWPHNFFIFFLSTENFSANLDLKDKYGRNVVAALIWCGGPR